jgi:hypothetical protein
MGHPMATPPFLLHPENGPFVRGETNRLPRLSGVVCVIVPVLVALVAMPCFWIGHYRWKEAQSFDANRTVAIGTVVSRRIDSSVAMVDFEFGTVHSDEEYLVHYRFEAAGPVGAQAFDREASVSEDDYNRLQPGAPLTVTYDRTDPSVSRIVEETASAPHVVLAVLGVMTLVMAGVTGLVLAVWWWKWRRLARDGQRLQGSVVSCTTKNDDEGRLVVDLQYRFVTPSGREITDTVTSSRKDWTEAARPEPQTPVVVLYLSDTNYQLL